MPSNWPELSLALALALVAAYVVTSFLGRRIERWLRALVPDDREHYLVDSPLPVIRGLLFVVTAAIVAIPALRLAGYRPFSTRNPEVFTEWLLSSGLSIVFIADRGLHHHPHRLHGDPSARARDVRRHRARRHRAHQARADARHVCCRTR